MLGLGSTITKSARSVPTIVSDGLVLKHGYARGPVQPCSTGAASFTASNTDYVDMGDVCDLGTGDFSISCWVNLGSKTTDQYIISKFVDANNFWYLRTQGSSQIQFYSKVSGSDVIDRGTGTSLAGNTWHHVAITADRGTATKSYINGVEMGSGASSATDLDNAASLYFGRADGSYLGGYMANVGVWSAALTQPQIKSIMHKDYASLSASEKTGLVSWWNLDSVIDSVAASTAVYDNHYAGGSELGAEMINNGSFDENDTGWDIDSGGAGTTKTWVNSFGGREGVLHVSIQGTDSTNNRLKQSIDYVSGAWYKVQADIYVVSGVVRIDGKDADMLGGTGGDVITTSGTGSWVTYTAYGYTPTTTSSNTDSLFIRALASSTAEFYIDNISVKLVNGNTGTLA